jgi:predicted metal-dependent HD superfamily phosphohydrolase
MEDVQTNLIQEAEKQVRQLTSEHLKKDYYFHTFDHTRQVVEAAMEIADGFDLTEKEVELLLIAAWFHDTGYVDDPEAHEEKSGERAEAFMENYPFSEDEKKRVRGMILATQVPQKPRTLLEQILCDADLSHLGRKTYWNLCGKLRMELTATQNMLLSEQEWVEQEMAFLKDHQYHTYVANNLYNKGKEKHLKQLRKRQRRLEPEIELTPEEAARRMRKQKKKKKKDKVGFLKEKTNMELSQLNLGRGVETMYRNTYRTHINLSSIADNKANIMLSINAIIVSITVSTLVPRFAEMPRIIAPTVALLIVCLLSIVFATLSTRPKVTEGRFTREDIENRRSNLLFFGNFYRMNLDDFHWGMMEMIKDSDFLYSSMTRDLYYLGIVLAKKYAYLRICYNIFMYGLIAAVLIFAIAFIDFTPNQ